MRCSDEMRHQGIASSARADELALLLREGGRTVDEQGPRREGARAAAKRAQRTAEDIIQQASAIVHGAWNEGHAEQINCKGIAKDRGRTFVSQFFFPSRPGAGVNP